MKNICVFCSSSNKINRKYHEDAQKIGQLIADKGYTFVFGGANVGLMNMIASEVKKKNGKIIGVLLEKFQGLNLEFSGATSLNIAKDLMNRKAEMIKQSDAFVILPGGLGTLDELFEVLTLKQIGELNNKPIVIINSHHFFDDLIKQLDRFFEEEFISIEHKNLYQIVEGVEQAFNIIK